MPAAAAPVIFTGKYGSRPLLPFPTRTIAKLTPAAFPWGKLIAPCHLETSIPTAIAPVLSAADAFSLGATVTNAVRDTTAVSIKAMAVVITLLKTLLLILSLLIFVMYCILRIAIQGSPKHLLLRAY